MTFKYDPYLLLPLLFLLALLIGFQYQPRYDEIGNLQVVNAKTEPRPHLPPILNLLLPKASGLTVTVDGSTLPGTQSETIIRISWNWGDGSREDHWFPAVHSYSRPGTYTIMVTSFQSDGLSTIGSVSVVLLPPPETVTVQTAPETVTVQPPTRTVTVQSPAQTVTIQPPTPAQTDLTLVYAIAVAAGTAILGLAILLAYVLRMRAARAISATTPSDFEVFVSIPSVGKTVNVEAALGHTVGSLVDTLTSTLDLAKDKAYAVEYAGKLISQAEFGKTLATFGIKEGSKLSLRVVE